MVLTWNEIIDHDHDAIAQEALERALIAEDQLTQALMIFAQHGHHFLGLGAVGEGGEAAQVTKQHGNLAPMTRQQRLSVFRGGDHPRDLRCEEPLQTAHSFDFRQLLGHFFLQKLIPA